VTEPLLDRYSGRIINVHPADLSVTEGQRRKYVGLHSVRDAILAGETELSSSTHVVRERVDYGEILMISEPIDVLLPTGFTVQDLRKSENFSKLDRVVRRNQNGLKKHGDWVIFPKTLEYIAEGRFALDGAGSVYLDGRLVPNGLRL
jgi:folate-dependent phosphoribosylglycinamide formyltransferase PurN